MQKRTPYLAILLGLTALYTLGFFAWYGQTPLGISPVLDGKENLLMAHQIAEGTLADEPFYRAPLYPALLALLKLIGIPENGLPLFARLLNALAHLTSVALIYQLVSRIWHKTVPAFAAALLYGLNPVALHFAADPLDITLAIALFLWALQLAQKQLTQITPRETCLAAIAIVLATAARPHFLMVVGGLFLFFLWLNRRQALYFGATAGFLFLLLGSINWGHSGQFKILPTQGAYNLWAANKPGAHGKYFSLSTLVQNQEQHSNPTRLESEKLYYAETQTTPPASLDTINNYWRKKTVTSFLQNPVDLILRLIRKSYFLINNYEQYNNKTFAVHKALSPWLEYNPINWTLLLFLGSAGLLLTLKQSSTRLILLCFLVYAGGVLLFFVSARFRLPLVPLLTIFSGGLFAQFPQLFHHSRNKIAFGAASVLALTATSLTHFANVDDPITVAEDFMLIAQASAEQNNDEKALSWAQQAIMANPEMLSARELICTSKYNLMLEKLPKLPSTEALTQNLNQCLIVLNYSEQIQFISGVYLHHLNRIKESTTLWHRLAATDNAQQQSALGALLATQQINADEIELLAQIPTNQKSTLLLQVEARTGNLQAQAELGNRLTLQQIVEQQELLQALFPLAN